MKTRIRTLDEMRMEIIGRALRASNADMMMIYAQIFHAEFKGLRISTDDDRRYYIEAKGYGKHTLKDDRNSATSNEEKK
jgi:hypothetical protein